MKKSYVAGVDIGGTHITAALVDLEEKKIVTSSYVRKMINAQDDAKAIVDAWCEVINQAMHSLPLKVEKIGIAMPGPFDYAAGVSYITGQNKYESLYQVNVKQLLAERLQLQTEHIRFMNDAACFLQGEIFSGAAMHAKTAFGVTLGTGLGTARYSNGLAEDADLWRFPFRGRIAEDYISTRWFVSRCYALTGQQLAGVKEILEHPSVTHCVQQLFDEFADHLSDFIAAATANETPETLVLGGNITQAHHLFFPRLEQNLRSAGCYTKPVKAALGEAAFVYGAAGVWSFVGCD